MSIFLSYEGITGESSDNNHKDWIDVDDFCFGVKRRITSCASTRGNRESSGATITDLTLTRRVDRATPNIFLAACCGKGKTAVIRMTKTGSGNGGDVFLEYILKNALISGYDVIAESQSDIRPTEQITISFVDLETRYTAYDGDGAALPPVVVGYDTATNTKR